MAMDLDHVLRTLAGTESNLKRCEALIQEIEGMIPPSGTVRFFCDGDPDLEKFIDLRDKLYEYMDALPQIDGFRPEKCVCDLNSLAEMRLDLGPIVIDPFEEIEAGSYPYRQGVELKAYRKRFNAKRHELLFGRQLEQLEAVDDIVHQMNKSLDASPDDKDAGIEEAEKIQAAVDTLAILLGSEDKPPRWHDLQRHLYFNCRGDREDICKIDWPVVRDSIKERIVSLRDKPVALPVADLSGLSAASTSGPLSISMKWESVSSDQFEDLLYDLLSEAEDYQNVQLLMPTNAPDRGRDVSAERIIRDSLGLTTTQRVIVQCKHWMSKSVSLKDLSDLDAQIGLWEPPRVHSIIVATTGRFTADAVRWVEQRNDQGGHRSIQLWSEKHLEKLLAVQMPLAVKYGLLAP